MSARNPSASLPRWGQATLLVALLGLPLYANCTKSEDTEPFVPATEGAKQPGGSGPLVSEEAACERVRDAFQARLKALKCDVSAPPACPAFIRPGAGNGCYEYFESSVDACVSSYEKATSCAGLSGCIVSAQRNDELETCMTEQAVGGSGSGGQAGEVGPGGAAQGGGSSSEQAGAGALPQAGAGGSPDASQGGNGG